MNNRAIIIEALHKQLTSLSQAELLLIAEGFKAVGESGEFQYHGAKNDAIRNLIRAIFFDDRDSVNERIDRIIQELQHLKD